MSNNDIDRKIAVILATDLVGYSKHMEKNERMLHYEVFVNVTRSLKSLLKNKKDVSSIQVVTLSLLSFQVLLLQLIQQLSFKIK